MDVKEYKKYHEEHMMHNTGTSAKECALLIFTVPLCVFLSSYLSSYKMKTTSFGLEFFLIILPVILNCTIFSDVNFIIFFYFALLCNTLIILKLDPNTLRSLLNKECKGRKSFISNYRASTNFISAICILAVDFKVFPKRLAKTESFGFGFMDLGVGCFICSNGFVEKRQTLQGQFTKILKTVSIFCGLGIIRLLSVKSIDYHEHVSEYGAHWNFFFTLALCRLLSYFLIILTNDANPLYLSLITGCLHQVLLLFGFQDWVLSETPRDSFISANREGLVSCLGYISLYFAASSIRKYTMMYLTYKTLIVKLFHICLVTFVGAAMSYVFFDVSRRLCNLGYILWILFLSSMALILFVILEVILMSLKKGKEVNTFLTEPTILQSLNEYGLFFFLFSNLLTGLVNLVFQTLLLDRVISLVIIISYMITLCLTNYLIYCKKYLFIYEVVNI